MCEDKDGQAVKDQKTQPKTHPHQMFFTNLNCHYPSPHKWGLNSLDSDVKNMYVETHNCFSSFVIICLLFFVKIVSCCSLPLCLELFLKTNILKKKVYSKLRLLIKRLERFSTVFFPVSSFSSLINPKIAQVIRFLLFKVAVQKLQVKTVHYD